MDPTDNESIGFVNVENYKRLKELEEEYEIELQAFENLQEQGLEFTVENLTEAVKKIDPAPSAYKIQNYYDMVQGVIGGGTVIDDQVVTKQEHLDLFDLATPHLESKIVRASQIEPEEYQKEKKRLETDLEEGEINQAIYDDKIKDLNEKQKKRRVRLFKLQSDFYPEIYKYNKEKAEVYAAEVILNSPELEKNRKEIVADNLAARNAFAFTMVNDFLRNPEAYRKHFEEQEDFSVPVNYLEAYERTKAQKDADEKLDREYNKYIQKEIKKGNIVVPAVSLELVLRQSTENSIKAYTFLKEYKTATVLFNKEVERRKKENPNVKESAIVQGLRVELEMLSNEEKQKSLLYQSYLFGDYTLDDLMTQEKSLEEVLLAVPKEHRGYAQEVVTDNLQRRKNLLETSEYYGTNLQNIFYYIGRYGFDPNKDIRTEQLDFFFHNFENIGPTGELITEIDEATPLDPEFLKSREKFINSMNELNIDTYEDFKNAIYKANRVQQFLMETEAVYLTTAIDPQFYVEGDFGFDGIDEASEAIVRKYTEFKTGDKLKYGPSTGPSFELAEDKIKISGEKLDQVKKMEYTDTGDAVGQLLEKAGGRNIFNEMPEENAVFTVDLVYHLNRDQRGGFLKGIIGSDYFDSTKTEVEDYVKSQSEGNFSGFLRSVGSNIYNRFLTRKPDADEIAARSISGEIRLLIDDTKAQIEAAKLQGDDEKVKALQRQLYKQQQELIGTVMTHEVLKTNNTGLLNQAYTLVDQLAFGSLSAFSSQVDIGEVFTNASTTVTRVEDEVLRDIKRYQTYQKGSPNFRHLPQIPALSSEFDSHYRELDLNKEYNRNNPEVQKYVMLVLKHRAANKPRMTSLENKMIYAYLTGFPEATYEDLTSFISRSAIKADEVKKVNDSKIVESAGFARNIKEEFGVDRIFDEETGEYRPYTIDDMDETFLNMKYEDIPAGTPEDPGFRALFPGVEGETIREIIQKDEFNKNSVLLLANTLLDSLELQEMSGNIGHVVNLLSYDQTISPSGTLVLKGNSRGKLLIQATQTIESMTAQMPVTTADHPLFDVMGSGFNPATAMTAPLTMGKGTFDLTLGNLYNLTFGSGELKSFSDINFLYTSYAHLHGGGAASRDQYRQLEFERRKGLLKTTNIYPEMWFFDRVLQEQFYLYIDEQRRLENKDRIGFAELERYIKDFLYSEEEAQKLVDQYNYKTLKDAQDKGIIDKYYKEGIFGDAETTFGKGYAVTLTDELSHVPFVLGTPTGMDFYFQENLPDIYTGVYPIDSTYTDRLLPSISNIAPGFQEGMSFVAGGLGFTNGDVYNTNFGLGTGIANTFPFEGLFLKGVTTPVKAGMRAFKLGRKVGGTDGLGVAAKVVVDEINPPLIYKVAYPPLVALDFIEYGLNKRIARKAYDNSFDTFDVPSLKPDEPSVQVKVSNTTSNLTNEIMNDADTINEIIDDIEKAEGGPITEVPAKAAVPFILSTLAARFTGSLFGGEAVGADLFTLFYNEAYRDALTNLRLRVAGFAIRSKNEKLARLIIAPAYMRKKANLEVFLLNNEARKIDSDLKQGKEVFTKVFTDAEKKKDVNGKAAYYLQDLFSDILIRLGIRPQEARIRIDDLANKNKKDNALTMKSITDNTDKLLRKQDEAEKLLREDLKTNKIDEKEYSDLSTDELISFVKDKNRDLPKKQKIKIPSELIYIQQVKNLAKNNRNAVSTDTLLGRDLRVVTSDGYKSFKQNIEALVKTGDMSKEQAEFQISFHRGQALFVDNPNRYFNKFVIDINQKTKPHESLEKDTYTPKELLNELKEKSLTDSDSYYKSTGLYDYILNSGNETLTSQNVKDYLAAFELDQVVDDFDQVVSESVTPIRPLEEKLFTVEDMNFNNPSPKMKDYKTVMVQIQEKECIVYFTQKNEVITIGELHLKEDYLLSAEDDAQLRVDVTKNFIYEKIKEGNDKFVWNTDDVFYQLKSATPKAKKSYNTKLNNYFETFGKDLRSSDENSAKINRRVVREIQKKHNVPVDNTVTKYRSTADIKTTQLEDALDRDEITKQNVEANIARHEKFIKFRQNDIITINTYSEDNLNIFLDRVNTIEDFDALLDNYTLLFSEKRKNNIISDFAIRMSNGESLDDLKQGFANDFSFEKQKAKIKKQRQIKDEQKNIVREVSNAEVLEIELSESIKKKYKSDPEAVTIDKEAKQIGANTQVFQGKANNEYIAVNSTSPNNVAFFERVQLSKGDKHTENKTVTVNKIRNVSTQRFDALSLKLSQKYNDLQNAKNENQKTKIILQIQNIYTEIDRALANEGKPSQLSRKRTQLEKFLKDLQDGKEPSIPKGIETLFSLEKAQHPLRQVVRDLITEEDLDGTGIAHPTNNIVLGSLIRQEIKSAGVQPEIFKYVDEAGVEFDVLVIKEEDKQIINKMGLGKAVDPKDTRTAKDAVSVAGKELNIYQLDNQIKKTKTKHKNEQKVYLQDIKSTDNEIKAQNNKIRDLRAEKSQLQKEIKTLETKKVASENKLKNLEAKTIEDKPENQKNIRANKANKTKNKNIIKKSEESIKEKQQSVEQINTEMKERNSVIEEIKNDPIYVKFYEDYDLLLEKQKTELENLEAARTVAADTGETFEILGGYTNKELDAKRNKVVKEQRQMIGETPVIDEYIAADDILSLLTNNADTLLKLLSDQEYDELLQTLPSEMLDKRQITKEGKQILAYTFNFIQNNQSQVSTSRIEQIANFKRHIVEKLSLANLKENVKEGGNQNTSNLTKILTTFMNPTDSLDQIAVDANTQKIVGNFIDAANQFEGPIARGIEGIQQISSDTNRDFKNLIYRATYIERELTQQKREYTQLEEKAIAAIGERKFLNDELVFDLRPSMYPDIHDPSKLLPEKKRAAQDKARRDVAVRNNIDMADVTDEMISNRMNENDFFITPQDIDEAFLNQYKEQKTVDRANLVIRALAYAQTRVAMKEIKGEVVVLTSKTIVPVGQEQTYYRASQKRIESIFEKPIEEIADDFNVIPEEMRDKYDILDINGKAQPLMEITDRAVKRNFKNFLRQVRNTPGRYAINDSLKTRIDQVSLDDATELKTRVNKLKSEGKEVPEELEKELKSKTLLFRQNELAELRDAIIDVSVPTMSRRNFALETANKNFATAVVSGFMDLLATSGPVSGAIAGGGAGTLAAGPVGFVAGAVIGSGAGFIPKDFRKKAVDLLKEKTRVIVDVILENESPSLLAERSVGFGEKGVAEVVGKAIQPATYKNFFFESNKAQKSLLEQPAVREHFESYRNAMRSASENLIFLFDEISRTTSAKKIAEAKRILDPTTLNHDLTDDLKPAVLQIVQMLPRLLNPPVKPYLVSTIDMLANTINGVKVQIKGRTVRETEKQINEIIALMENNNLDTTRARSAKKQIINHMKSEDGKSPVPSKDIEYLNKQQANLIAGDILDFDTLKSLMPNIEMVFEDAPVSVQNALTELKEIIEKDIVLNLKKKQFDKSTSRVDLPKTDIEKNFLRNLSIITDEILNKQRQVISIGETILECLPGQREMKGGIEQIAYTLFYMGYISSVDRKLSDHGVGSFKFEVGKPPSGPVWTNTHLSQLAKQYGYVSNTGKVHETLFGVNIYQKLSQQEIVEVANKIINNSYNEKRLTLFGLAEGSDLSLKLTREGKDIGGIGRRADYAAVLMEMLMRLIAREEQGKLAKKLVETHMYGDIQTVSRDKLIEYSMNPITEKQALMDAVTAYVDQYMKNGNILPKDERVSLTVLQRIAADIGESIIDAYGIRPKKSGQDKQIVEFLSPDGRVYLVPRGMADMYQQQLDLLAPAGKAAFDKGVHLNDYKARQKHARKVYNNLQLFEEMKKEVAKLIVSNKDLNLNKKQAMVIVEEYILMTSPEQMMTDKALAKAFKDAGIEEPTLETRENLRALTVSDDPEKAPLILSLIDDFKRKKLNEILNKKELTLFGMFNKPLEKFVLNLSEKNKDTLSALLDNSEIVEAIHINKENKLENDANISIERNYRNSRYLLGFLHKASTIVSAPFGNVFKLLSETILFPIKVKKQAVTSGFVFPTIAYYTANAFGAVTQMFLTEGFSAPSKLAKAIGEDYGIYVETILYMHGGVGGKRISARPEDRHFITSDGRIFNAQTLAIEANKHGLGSSFVTAELGRQFLTDLRRSEIKFLKSSLFADQYLEFAESLDNCFRLATFMYHVKRGKSSSAAAKISRDTYFDYADLSNFEKNIMRNIFLFYSFIRKNQIQIFRALVNNPERVFSQLRMIRNSQKEFLEDRNLNSLPDWMQFRLFMFGADFEYSTKAVQGIAENEMSMPVHVLPQLGVADAAYQMALFVPALEYAGFKIADVFKAVDEKSKADLGDAYDDTIIAFKEFSNQMFGGFNPYFLCALQYAREKTLFMERDLMELRIPREVVEGVFINNPAMDPLFNINNDGGLISMSLHVPDTENLLVSDNYFYYPTTPDDAVKLMFFLEAASSTPIVSIAFGRQKKFYYDFLGKILNGAITGDEIPMPEGPTLKSDFYQGLGMTVLKVPTVEKASFDPLYEAKESLED